MQTQCLARAKLMHFKKLDCYMLKVAFNVRELDDRGHYKFPTQKHCAFVSGHIPRQTLKEELPRVLAQARALLRTDNIEVV